MLSHAKSYLVHSNELPIFGHQLAFKDIQQGHSAGNRTQACLAIAAPACRQEWENFDSSKGRPLG